MMVARSTPKVRAARLDDPKTSAAQGLLETLEPRVLLDSITPIDTGIPFPGVPVRNEIIPETLAPQRKRELFIDLNRDGIQDQVFARGRAVTIRLSTQLVPVPGSVGEPVPFYLSQRVLLPGRIDSLYLADTNGDGRLDIVALTNQNLRSANATVRNIQFDTRTFSYKFRSQRILGENLATTDVLIATGRLDDNARQGVVVVTTPQGGEQSSLLTIITNAGGKLLRPRFEFLTNRATSIRDAAIPLSTATAFLLTTTDGAGSDRTLVNLVTFEPVFPPTLIPIPFGNQSGFMPVSPAAGSPPPRAQLRPLVHFGPGFTQSFDLVAVQAIESPHAVGFIDWHLSIAGDGEIINRAIPRTAPIGVEATLSGEREGPWMDSLRVSFIQSLPPSTVEILVLMTEGVGRVMQDDEGAVSSVRFYFDADNDGQLTDADTLIHEDVEPGDFWSFASPVLSEWISITPFGTNFFAQAFDSTGLGGPVRKVNVILF